MAMTTQSLRTQQVYGERYHLVRESSGLLKLSNNMNEVRMDSQETTSNAAQSPSNRELNVVKPNPPLPTVYRARPQGPPGLPRHPVNNGPVGQPRPGHGQPQIRFDNRSAPTGPGNHQFVQLRPYGPPRPAGAPYPQKPAQHPPNIVPRFPQSQLQRPPRPPPPPHPGNYRKFQGGLQRPQQPRQEYPQQRSQDSQRSREIAQGQRNESLLNVGFRQNLEQRREEGKQQVARALSRLDNKMADVDNSKKLQQFETSKERSELRENDDDDDDDDVVMDGKSPRANGDVSDDVLIEAKLLRSDVQAVRRPETATINVKMADKPDVVAEKKIEKRVKDSNVAESDNRLSGKLDEETRKRTVDKEDVDNQMDEPERKLLKDQNEKENSNKENFDRVENSIKKDDDTKLTTQAHANSSPTLHVKDRVEKEGLSKESGTKVTIQADMHSSSVSFVKDETEREKNSSKKGDEETRTQIDANSVPPVEENLNKQSEDTKVTTRADTHPVPTVVEDKVTASIEKSAGEEKKSEQTSNTISIMSPEKSVPSTKPGEDNSQALSKPTPDKSPMKEGLKTSASLDKSSNIAMEVSQNEGETGKPGEQSKSREEVKASKNEESKEDRKMEKEIESETKSEDASKDKDEEESKVAEDRSMETSKEEAESQKEVAESWGKSLDPVHSPKEKESSDPSANLVEESVSKNSRPECLEQKSVSRPASGKEASETKAPLLSEDREEVAESASSPSKSPEEGTKGFDNGQQRSLSIKSSPSQSLRSPVSPKSPTDDNKLKEVKTEEGKKDEAKTTPETKSLSKSATPKRAATSGKQDKKSRKKSSTTPEVENGSVTNESVQSNAEPTTNGVEDSPTKKSPSKTKEADKRSTAGSPVKSPSKSVKSLPRTPDTPSSTTALEKKKLPMNKIQVGSAPSPNLKTVRSKIGSLENASYKPGGGKVKIENRKLDFSKAQPKIAAKNEKYTPSGGDKKIAQIKLQWNAKPKVGSLENATYKPGGGDKKIETVKLDFKDKAKPKVGSKENAKHIPGGGSIKSSATPPKTPQDTNNDIQTQKIDIKAESKVGSLDNVKHKPGGGDKKIFNDKEYLRQTGTNPESLCGSGSQENTVEEINSSLEQTKDDLPQPPPSTPTKIQNLPSPSSIITPKAIRSSLAKSPEIGSKKNSSSLETVEKEDKNKKNLSSEDKNIMKNRTAKSPIISHSLNNSQAKSPENRTMKSPTSSHVLNNSKSKSPEDSPTKIPTSSRPSSSSRLKNPEEKKSSTSPRPSNNSSLKTPEDKTMKSPISPRSASLQIKSPDKSPSHMSGKISPKELRLPKLAPSPIPQEMTTVPEAKINLPKLTERITH